MLRVCAAEFATRAVSAPVAYNAAVRSVRHCRQGVRKRLCPVRFKSRPAI
ncbi:hypothetical protein [Treponema endosymbiont of Eucomonympha sp.]|nr:hypothetical protein [Treponema endosymbiont of Eucomonympha sp.]